MQLQANTQETHKNAAENDTETCENCEGTGQVYRYEWETEKRECLDCLELVDYGLGEFLPVDSHYKEMILNKIISTRGKNKGTLRASRPKCEQTILGRRAYYVWRLARFHGGLDMCMPMMAEIENGDDPFLDSLTLLSEQVARDYLGTDLAAAARWSHLI